MKFLHSIHVKLKVLANQQQIDALRKEHNKIEEEQDSLANQGYTADDPHMENLEKKRVQIAKKLAALRKAAVVPNRR
jgi:hypothetical protein